MHPITNTPYELLSPWEPSLLAMAVYVSAVIVAMAVVLVLTSRLGPRNPNPDKDRVYESGVIPSGQAQFDFPVPFYMIAAFFLIFDVESAYILSWAVAFKPLGFGGWIKITFFILVLLVSLFYVWAKGGLDRGISARGADKR
ncbi:MAG: NADH-quinone oxidoreductase subunit A [Thermodesulfobacteriota bacterium]